MIEAGKYRAKAVDAGIGLTESGKEQVAVQFELLDMPGHTITAYLYFTEKTTDRTLESLRYCGWSTDDVCDLRGIGDNEVSIVVEHAEYQGKVQAKVAWINKIGGGVAIKNAMLESSKAAFSQRMKAAAIVSRAKAPPPAAAKKAPPVNAGDAYEEPDF